MKYAIHTHSMLLLYGRIEAHLYFSIVVKIQTNSLV
jgi:hypothetical protein